MVAKGKDSTADALQLLDDFDVSADTPKKAAGTGAGADGEAAEALAFLDELTTTKPASGTAAAVAAKASIIRPSSRASIAAPTQRRSLESSRAAIAAARSGSPAPASDRASPSTHTPPPEAATSQAQAQGGGGWGWGSVWSAASAAQKAATAAVQQAQRVVDEQVKQLPNSIQNLPATMPRPNIPAGYDEQARRWGEGVMGYVKNAQLDKLSQDLRQRGIAAFTDILNVVAPPISEHEVIQIWLSHDMEGYEGVENLVYRALARIMEQVEGGDLVVNKGNESRPKESLEGIKNLNAVDGQDAAFKLAQANVDELSKSEDKAAKPATDSTVTNPTTYSSVFLRIQPFFASHGFPPVSTKTPAADMVPENDTKPDTRHLHFLLHLHDPVHDLTHTTVSQAVPARWLPIWDDANEWVEDLVVESLRVAVEVVGQEYVVERMGWGNGTKKSPATERQLNDEKDEANAAAALSAVGV
ncbi:maintenance of telomere capping protein 1 [Auriculariales sp. MPI-PUGE-AT-0066]|nr:maintenance of telomere capping protein 1 [Auriculariales sp. MPI-PUGE-AT-0066]